MRRISELLKKHQGIWSLRPDMTVFDALKTLAERNVGALMVMQGDQLLGVFSERDYTRKVALEGRSSRDTLVRDIMTAQQLITVSADASIDEGMALMSQKKIRHLPVVRGSKVVGMISIRDLMDEMLLEREETIKQLQTYIAG